MTNRIPATCSSCQTDAKREAGETVTEAELANWRLWGCTCSEQDSAEAQAWVARVTR